MNGSRSSRLTEPSIHWGCWWRALLLRCLLAVPTGSCLLPNRSYAETDLSKAIPSLILKDGRVLENALLKAYNSKTVFVSCNQGVLQLRYEEFPDSLQPQLKAGREAALETNQRLGAPRLAPLIQTAPREEPAPLKRADEAKERAKLEAQQKKVQAELLAQIEKATHSGVETYFREQSTLGSGHSQIRRVTVKTEAPETVDGWTGRYTVKGKCQLDYYDHYVGGAGRGQTNCYFVATVEVDEAGKAKVTKIERGIVD